jgi:hypothetical protein
MNPWLGRGLSLAVGVVLGWLAGRKVRSCTAAIAAAASRRRRQSALLHSFSLPPASTG